MNIYLAAEVAVVIERGRQVPRGTAIRPSQLAGRPRPRQPLRACLRFRVCNRERRSRRDPVSFRRVMGRVVAGCLAGGVDRRSARRCVSNGLAGVVGDHPAVPLNH